MADSNGYFERVDQVVAYITDHLDEDLGLEQLASIACFSPFHFHRIYRVLQGETVSETIRRMRLHRAAVELLEQRFPIERIAARAGYKSQAAFTRAFRSSYGAPPARYQRNIQRTVEENPRMYEVEIKQEASFPVASVDHKGAYQEVGNAFERLLAQAGAAGLLGPGMRTFGMYYDDPKSVPEKELRSKACLRVSPEWKAQGELASDQVEGGRYAEIIHVGPYAELHKSYDWLVGQWLPGSGEELADRPCVEEYLNDPRTVPPAELQTRIWLPLV